MKSLMFLIAVLTVQSVWAQDSTTIFVEAGHSVYEVATPARMYRFPMFTAGKIVFKDGSTAEGNLNYNLFNEEIEFIAAKGDTLAIAKNQMLNIDIVTVGKQLFYFNNSVRQGYLEEVFNAKFGKLLKRERYALLKREKVGGYNQPSSTSAIDSYSSFNSGQGIMEAKLLVKENLTFVKKTDYFLGDKFNHFALASKRNLYNVFSKQRNEIDEYLKMNELNYNKADDLQRLLTYLQSSQPK
jgi:hypothetical protein